MMKIGIIAHYDMSKKFIHLEKTMDCELIFRVGVLNLAIDSAIKLEKENNVDAIITNSKTAEIIKKHVEIPVIDMYITNFNLIQALEKAKKYGDKVVFADIKKENSRYDFEYVKKMMGYDIDYYIFEEISETPMMVENAIKANKNVVVTSAGCMVSEARKRGLTSILIETQEHDIVDAIDRAKNIIKIRNKEVEKMKWLNSIVNNSNEGMLTIDNNGIVNIFNQVAEKILNLKAENVIGKNINTLRIKHEFFKKILNIKEIEIIKINDKEIVIDKRDVFSTNEYSGTVVNINELKSIQKLELKTRKKINPQGFIAKSTFEDIKGSSINILEVKNKAKKYAKTDSNILILGESGSGKEIFAQSIHNYSNNSSGPFLAVNCATLPEQLLESELFGYDEGAFTGAKKGGKMGLLEMAHGGTLFLDEIGEMPIQLQARLLRVLQEKVVRRIGGSKNIPINVRIISATNRDLYEDIKNNKFREDLYYRINVLSIKIPPLREHKEDIKEIVGNLVDKIAKRQNKNIYLKESHIKQLSKYNWPGNVRELYNFIERLIAISENDVIEEEFDEIFGELINRNTSMEESSEMLHSQDKIVVPIGSMKEMEGYIIKKIYDQNNKNKKKVEKILDISSTTLWRRFKEFQN